jgi:hypothetical protein
MINWFWLIPAFISGVIVAFQLNIIKNAAQIRRSSETIRLNSDLIRRQAEARLKESR